MNLHRIMLGAIIVMVIAAAVISLMQLWGFGFGWDLFIKLIVTLGGLILLAALLMVLCADLGQHKKMKDENYLD